MLAMASQSIEKNLRSRQSLDWALHKRWVGLSAEGRAMIAATVLSNSGETELPPELAMLADANLLEEGVRLGLAIRLFRRLDGGSDKLLEASALTAQGGRLLLSLGESRAALRGYQLDKDLANLAARLALDPALEVVPDEQIRRH